MKVLLISRVLRAAANGSAQIGDGVALDGGALKLPYRSPNRNRTIDFEFIVKASSVLRF